jgi:hypothetical protein
VLRSQSTALQVRNRGQQRAKRPLATKASICFRACSGTSPAPDSLIIGACGLSQSHFDGNLRTAHLWHEIVDKEPFCFGVSSGRASTWTRSSLSVHILSWRTWSKLLTCLP